MPSLTRWFVKSAMLYLVVALTLSIAMQLPPAVRAPWLNAVWPTYLHLLVVGWLTQLILGVAFWLFPKHPTGHSRGYDWRAWSCFALLNLGLLLRAAGEPWQGLGRPAAPILMVSAVAQLLAGWAFVTSIWPRVRER